MPIADQIESGSYLLYDGVCGTSGMLTVAEGTRQQLAEEHEKNVVIHLYGQEINAEIRADILALEQEMDGLLDQTLVGVG